MSSKEIYTQKLELVRKSLQIYYKGCIVQQWGDDFQSWLKYESAFELVDGFRRIFDDHLGKYIDLITYNYLYIAGIQIIVSIKAYMQMIPLCELETLLEFIRCLINEQIDEIDNWCDDILREIENELKREYK